MTASARSPYSVPLTELESVRVAAERQLTAQAELRYADPSPWTPLPPCDGGADGDGD